jgi:hypothetical protein
VKGYAKILQSHSSIEKLEAIALLGSIKVNEQDNSSNAGKPKAQESELLGQVISLHQTGKQSDGHDGGNHDRPKE